MEFETLQLDVRDGVAHLTLNRPAAANAMNLQMGKDLAYAAMRCDEDPAVRAVLISGAGKIFCGGGDVAAFAAAGDGLPALLKELTTYLHSAISRFARMRAPVIVAIQGAAAGAGLSLACAADLAVAAESARFTLAYTRIGLTPDGSSTYYLPRLVGARRALDLMLTNRMLSAAEALEWGLINRVVADDALKQESESLSRTLAAGPTNAFGGVKQLLLTNEGLESQMELEARMIADAGRNADGREGVKAFLEKLKAVFKGE